MNKQNLIKYLLAWLWLGLVSASCTHAATGAAPLAANAIESFQVSQQGGSIFLKLNLKEPLSSPPVGFSIANPSRLAFDFVGVANNLGKNTHTLNEGDLTSLNVVQAGERTRVVLNLTRNLNYTTRMDGNSILVTLSPLASTAKDGARVDHFVREAKPDARHAVRDISFRRGKDGEGRIVVDLADVGTGIDIRQQGKDLVVDFLKTDLPENLQRKLDVTDFATPVTQIATEKKGDNVRMTITPKGLWEHNAYQAENQFVVEVKPIIEDPNKLVQGSKIGYQGPRISINYQNGDVRALLRLMAEELDLNAVISETVTGTTTLVLKDVPADQVIDIIFQQKGLDMRKNGNVILIAPRDEITTREKLEFESKQTAEDLEPLQTQSFQVNYHKAIKIQEFLDPESVQGAVKRSDGKVQRILSKRGTATVDERTNQLFVQDIPSRLDQVRKIIAQVDVPVRQVMIEARVVEAVDNFAKNLGMRLGVRGLHNKNTFYGGDNIDTNKMGGFIVDDSGKRLPPTFPGLNQVNLPAAPVNGMDPSEFSFILFNSAMTRFLNLEISALEADLRGKIVSSPRVMTSDQVEASIEQGVEIPYYTISNDGAQVSFKKAVLSLKVKPHITPDGKISMALAVNKDAPGEMLPAGRAVNTKNIKTEVLVDNGGTVVIGGIYELTSRNDVTKVPVLGDVPIFGSLFRNTAKSNEKTELLVFITPRIVSETSAIR